MWAAGPVSAIACPKLTLRCGGIAMALKGWPSVLRELKATVDPRRPHVQFDGLGTCDGAHGRPPRIARRLRRTDDVVVHFTAYALWNSSARRSCSQDHDGR